MDSGIAWIAFVTACIAAALRFRWPWWALPVGLMVSVLPFLTVPFDLWMRTAAGSRPAGWSAATAPFPKLRTPPVPA